MTEQETMAMIAALRTLECRASRVLALNGVYFDHVEFDETGCNPRIIAVAYCDSGRECIDVPLRYLWMSDEEIVTALEKERQQHERLKQIAALESRIATARSAIAEIAKNEKLLSILKEQA